jgi:hypothetical protein
VVDAACSSVPGVASGSADPDCPGAAVRIIVHLAGEAGAARALADVLGAGHVIELPAAVAWLGEHLVPRAGSPVVAVLGAVGGAGATTMSIACALGAGQASLLIDADPLSVGMDLALDLPEVPGGRWAAVPDTGEPLVAESFRSAFPVVEGVTVVTGAAPPAGDRRVASVLRVGREHFTRTVVDAGRAPELVDPGDWTLVITPATLAGVVGTRRLLDRLPTDRVLVAVRPTAWLSARDVAEELGCSVRELPRIPKVAEMTDCGDLLRGRTGRALRRVGADIWGDLGWPI